jgi:hypothetical protein
MSTTEREVSVAVKFENALLEDSKFTRLNIFRDIEQESIKEIQHWLNTETNETVFLLDYEPNGADLLKNNPENDIQATLDYVGVDN